MNYDNRAVNQTFMACLIVVLHMLIAEEAILFPLTVTLFFILPTAQVSTTLHCDFSSIILTELIGSLRQ